MPKLQVNKERNAAIITVELNDDNEALQFHRYLIAHKSSSHEEAEKRLPYDTACLRNVVTITGEYDTIFQTLSDIANVYSGPNWITQEELQKIKSQWETRNPPAAPSLMWTRPPESRSPSPPTPLREVLVGGSDLKKP